MSQVNTNSGQSGGATTPAPLQPPQVGVVALGTPSVASSSKSNALATRPPEGFYVVIGRGAAATINLCTLLQASKGNERLAHPDNADVQLRIRLVGLPDPWASYHPHGMGQPPHLLALPGFRRKPDTMSSMIRSGMHSREFSQITHLTLEHAEKMGDIITHVGWAPFIQTRQPSGGAVAIDPALIESLKKEGLRVTKLEGLLAQDYPKEYPLYRVVVIDNRGDASFLYAHKIDICTGWGRPANEPRHGAATFEGRTQLWRPDYEWSYDTKNRCMLTGPEGLCSSTAWNATDRVCVWGAGGIGLNMIERAEDVGCYIDWFPNGRPPPGMTGLHRTFNLPRNDTVLKTKKDTTGKVPNPGRAMTPGESNLRKWTGLKVDTKNATDDGSPLLPAQPRWRFGDGTNLLTVAKDTSSTGGVVVTFEGVLPTSSSAKTGHMWDYNEDNALIDSGGFPQSPWYVDTHKPRAARWAANWYTRVIFCVGADNETSLGVPKVLIKEPFRALERFGRHVAMETADTRIRLLGAAAVMYPGRADRLKATPATESFFESLPFSAVPPGFIYAGVTIAEANGWFDDAHPNTNMNTMAKTDLVDHLKKTVPPSDADTLATEIIEARRRNNGIITQEWADAYKRANVSVGVGVVFTSVVKDAAKAMAGLTIDYGPSRPWRPWIK